MYFSAGSAVASLAYWSFFAGALALSAAFVLALCSDFAKGNARAGLEKWSGRFLVPGIALLSASLVLILAFKLFFRVPFAG